MANKKYDKEEGVWRTIGGRRVFIKTGVSLSQAMKDSGKFKRKGVTSEEYQRAENREHQLREEYNKLAREKGRRSDEAIQKEEELYDVRQKYESLMEKNPYVERKYGVNKQELSNLKGINKQDDYEYKLYKRAKENPDSIDPMTENSTDWEALDSKYKDRYEKEARTTKQVNDEYNALSKKMQQDDYYYKVEDDRKLKELRAEYDTLVARGQEDVNLTEYNKKEKTYHVPYQNGGVYTGGKTIKDYYEAKVYNEDDESTSVLIPRSIHVTKDQLVEWNNGKSNFKAGDMVKAPYGIGNTYDSEKMYDLKLLKDGDYPELEGKIEMHMTRQQAEGFEKDYQKLNDDLYQTKVFGSDVTKMDKQMKDLFGENFKYDEGKSFDRDNTYWNGKGKYRNYVDTIDGLSDEQLQERGISKGLINQYRDEAHRYYRYFNDGDMPHQKTLNGKTYSRYYKNIPYGSDERKYWEDTYASDMENRINSILGKMQDSEMKTLTTRYKGTINYLQQSTNMTIPEIYELLKKIEKDRK